MRARQTRVQQVHCNILQYNLIHRTSLNSFLFQRQIAFISKPEHGTGPSKAQAAAESRREADILSNAADMLDNKLPASHIQPASISARGRPRRATKRQITSLCAVEDGRLAEEYEPAECSHTDLGSQVLIIEAKNVDDKGADIYLCNRTFSGKMMRTCPKGVTHMHLLDKYPANELSWHFET